MANSIIRSLVTTAPGPVDTIYRSPSKHSNRFKSVFQRVSPTSKYCLSAQVPTGMTKAVLSEKTVYPMPVEDTVNGVSLIVVPD